jgi:hypothetical protein
VFPYTAANDDGAHPAVYTLSYALRPDAKVIIKLQEPLPNERFIEITEYFRTRPFCFFNLNTRRYILSNIS